MRVFSDLSYLSFPMRELLIKRVSFLLKKPTVVNLLPLSLTFASSSNPTSVYRIICYICSLHSVGWWLGCFTLSLHTLSTPLGRVATMASANTTSLGGLHQRHPPQTLLSDWTTHCDVKADYTLL